MKVLLINSVCGIGSTGRICTDLAQAFAAQGHEVKIAYGRGVVPEEYRKYAVRIGTNLDLLLHVIRTRILDQHGLGSTAATKRFLQWAESYNPDLLWLHNIHGYYINYELLFAWIKNRPEMIVKWTLHDCWAFTGHCTHFAVANCDRWKTQCKLCLQLDHYPVSIFRDYSSNNYVRKKASFSGVKRMTLIAPSQWLATLVKQSFLKEYQIEVHYNTIDSNIFKPTYSDFRERYGIHDKKMILGVAGVWSDRKGLKDFIKLRKIMDDSYIIVLVGLTKKQICCLPPGILGIRRTNSPHELASIYSAADVFVNLSIEETFGMTTVEAQSCGTKAVVYDIGGCAESLFLPDSVAIPVGDFDRLKREIS